MTLPSTPPRRIVIIGGVAGGMSAATRLRRLDESLDIVVVERTNHVSYANCGLPYYVGGVITERQSLLLQTPASLGARFRLDVRVATEVTAIDPDQRVVTLRAITDGVESTLGYDELVLSPGARPVVPPIPGIERALALRSVEDTDRLSSAVALATGATAGPATAVVIGGGFIGLEVAENLAHRGMRVSLVEATDQVMAPLDPEMAAIVHARLRDQGVDLHLSDAVTSISEHRVELASGASLPADLVVAAIGVRPETALATAAGVALGPRGGIAVDEHFATNVEHVWAIGDAVEKIDGLTAEHTLVPLANTANRQGRVLADVLCGRSGKDRPTLGTAIVSVFGLTVAVTGLNEKRLRAAGRPVRVIHTHPASHASYYPGAETMSIKLLVDPDTDAILGAQAVGGDGVDKRIDVIATAIAGGLTASDLADLELAYAPPYGSAKDPVNMLGYVDQNLATGLTRSIQWHELADAMAAGEAVIDVRTEGEFAAGAIPGAINLPLDELRERLTELPEGPLVVHCAVGVRGHAGARLLAEHGRESRNLDGGYKTWVVSPAATSIALAS
ncbi:FAD-dependent oxidoreductase [Aestuariimicrobium kwangyangense]|uniref:FAD-dependent oxidoreductase n=1 Tax=Aestuariimicrobium kwangyangense TaxID=396389 RepID=UPI000590597C|nr:FAD-dependent oxidoreductase [Aestuariimicrobium kwangyangense]